MRITISMGSDHELSEEQKKTIIEKMQKHADDFFCDDSTKIVLEDHSYAGGGDYELIFKKTFGLDFDDYILLLNSISTYIMSVLGPEYHEWWITIE